MNNYFKNYDYFLTVKTSGNITKAAKILYVSQPTITQYLNRLESELGAPLFQRDAKPIVLTPAGEIFDEHVARYIELEKSLENKVASLKATVEGKLTVGIPLQLQPFYAQRLLFEFSKAYPDISINLSGHPSNELEKLTANNILDVSIVHIDHKEYPNLKYDIIQDDPIILICNAGNPIVNGRSSTPDEPIPVSLAELADSTMYLMEPEYIVRKAAEKIFQPDDGRPAFKPASIIEISSHSAIISLCSMENNPGLGFIPASICHMYECPPNLSYLRVTDREVVLQYAMIHAGSHLSPQTQCFLDFARAHWPLVAINAPQKRGGGAKNI